jgi:ATP-dependent helicase HrpA
MALVRKRRTAQDTIRRIFVQKSTIAPLPVEQEADFQNHLNDIFPLDIFFYTTPPDIANIDRQLQSLIVRLDRFQGNPGKDSQKAAQLLPYLQKMHQLLEKREELSKEALEQLLHFRDLVNEYRISLFSPELKTREPISPKKLDKHWKSLLTKC